MRIFAASVESCESLPLGESCGRKHGVSLESRMVGDVNEARCCIVASGHSVVLCDENTFATSLCHAALHGLEKCVRVAPCHWKQMRV